MACNGTGKTLQCIKDHTKSYALRAAVDDISVISLGSNSCPNEMLALAGETYSHKDPEECDRQVGTW